MMQAFRTENNYRNASRLSAAELRAAMASREILQSTALAFDTQRQLSAPTEPTPAAYGTSPY